MYFNTTFLGLFPSRKTAVGIGQYHSRAGISPKSLDYESDIENILKHNW